MTAFYNFNHAILVCFDFHSLNSDIQYLKAIAIDRDYNPPIIDIAIFKLQHPHS